MVSILKNSYNKIKSKINQKINKTKNNVSNLVLAILMTTWIWIATKAEANIKHIEYSSNYHKVVKWDSLFKIAKKYWLTLNELIELNKSNKFWKRNSISENKTIYIWSKLIVKKSNKSEILIAKKVNNLKILNSLKVKKDIKPTSSITKEKIEPKIQTKKIEKKEEKESIQQIKLNHALKYSAMYEKKWTKYKKHYTISPSDTPYFTWKVKKISWKIYIEVRLANDKNITWFVSIKAFDSQSKSKIKEYLKTWKTTTKIVRKEKIEEKKILTKDELIQKWIEKSIFQTLKFASSKRNIISINDNYILSVLSLKLTHTKSIIKNIKNEDSIREFLWHKINVLTIWLNKKAKIDIKKDDIVKIFDYYATLERLYSAKQYFTKIWFERLYINHIEKDFWWKWVLWLKTISKKLFLKESITKLNPTIVENIKELRKKWIERLLATIAKAENTNDNYNAIFSNWNQHKIKYTQMTIREVLKDMRKRIKTKWSSATGKYQFMYLTLKNLAKTYKIDIDKQLFSPEFQEKIARIKLKERWLEKFIKWELDRDHFQINLSAEWASLAKDESWKSYHHNDWINKAFCSNKTIDSVLDRIKNPKPETKTLLASL